MTILSADSQWITKFSHVIIRPRLKEAPTILSNKDYHNNINTAYINVNKINNILRNDNNVK